jgi:hypothetical protein
MWIRDPGKTGADRESDWESVENPHQAGEIAVWPPRAADEYSDKRSHKRERHAADTDHGHGDGRSRPRTKALGVFLRFVTHAVIPLACLAVCPAS